MGTETAALIVISHGSKRSTWLKPFEQIREEAQGLLAREYGHGMTWGTGEHGWLDNAVYLTQPYNQNTVAEVVIGVPERGWPDGYAINLP